MVIINVINNTIVNRELKDIDDAMEYLEDFFDDEDEETDDDEDEEVENKKKKKKK